MPPTPHNLARTRPEQQPPGDGLKTAKHHLNPDANIAKNPPPQRGEVTSLKPLKEKKQAPARRQKTRRNLARTHPEQQPPGDGDTPRAATSRRWTQNSQTPPKSGRKHSQKPSPAAWRSDKSETPKGEETGPSTWPQDATQPSPATPKTATSPPTYTENVTQPTPNNP